MTTTQGAAAVTQTDDRDRRGLGILDRAQCLERIRPLTVGRLGFVHAGQVVVLPVNYVLRGEVVLFRTTWGSKLEAVTGGGPVTFEVDDYHEGSHTGWSVLVQAAPALVEDSAVRQELDGLGTSWAPMGENAFWVALRIEQISGREILGA